MKKKVDEKSWKESWKKVEKKLKKVAKRLKKYEKKSLKKIYEKLTKSWENIARGTTDPGYWVYDLNDFSDWNRFEIIPVEKD